MPRVAKSRRKQLRKRVADAKHGFESGQNASFVFVTVRLGTHGGQGFEWGQQSRPLYGKPPFDGPPRKSA